jgi:outer membrane protein assembly factor BamB
MRRGSAKTSPTSPAIVPAHGVWTLVLNSQLTIAPAYDATHAYFPLEGDRLAAYVMPEGTLSWLVTAHPLLPPTAGDGLIFLVEAEGLVALRATDGSVAWQLAMENPPAVAPAFAAGWLIVGTKDGRVEAIHAADGTIAWQRSIGSPAHAPASLTADRVYASISDGRLVSLTLETGEPVWERHLGAAPTEILADGDRLYVGSADNYLYCVLARDGTIDWRWRTGGDIVGRPVSDERHVFFVALDNLLRAMDRKSGAQVWMRPLPVRPIAAPLLAGSTLVVAGQQPAQLRVFAVKDGTPAPGEPIVPGTPGPPVAAITTTYAPGADIPIVALKTADVGAAMPDTIPAEVVVDVPAVAKGSSLATDAETAAPPHIIEDPATHLPMLLMLTRDIARGAGVTLVRRDFEPPITPVSPLPDMVMIAPQTPTVPR